MSGAGYVLYSAQVGAAELALMKPSARIIVLSRGAIVAERAPVQPWAFKPFRRPLFYFVWRIINEIK